MATDTGSSPLVVFGSINLDVSVRAPHLPRPGETLLGGAALLSPGGKGANQAHAAQRFGVATRLFGMVGDDGFAAPALACLAAAGVDTAGVGVSNGSSTGLALITVSEAGENTIVVASGANLAARAAQVSDAVLKDSRVLLLQLELPPAESFALAQRARRCGCKVMLNASPLAPGSELDFSDLDLLIVNTIELDQLSAQHHVGSIQPMDRARELARVLQVDVLVTLGAEGSLLAQVGGGHLEARALAVNAVDTTGAGDTYAGVYAAAVAGGETQQRAMELASAAAGLACERPGAQLAQPDRAAIEARLSPRPLSR